MSSVHTLFRVILFSLPLLVLGVGSFPSVHAQSASTEMRSYQSGRVQDSDSRSNIGELPEWARPSSSEKAQREWRGRVTTNDREGPGSGPAVPVDGGLIWALCFGVGYGVYSLRKEQG